MIASQNTSLMAIALALVIPLLSALMQFALPNKFKLIGAKVGSTLLFICLGISIFIALSVWPQAFVQNVEWFVVGQKSFDFNIFIDQQAAMMLVIVTFISFLVHLFSLEYMKNDEGFKRYFGVLGLFSFSMIGLIYTDHLLIIFIFWELVGFCSYLLIGHWFKKDSAARASKKAFVVNRIGDAGLIIGLALCWLHFDSLSLAEIQGGLLNTTLSTAAFTALGLMLFVGAIGKSAQFPLQIWLPDAMEGPTPVSALIHAATMVAAGVYLLARITFLLSAQALVVIAIIGAITAFMGAVAALRQMDIKKVLAYSTVSQLGYMVMAVGLGNSNAAIFHLYTHAFFKAGLFLAAGAIIHSLHQADTSNNTDIQDMRNMGGLRRKMPITFVAYMMSAASLIGVPLFSGFLSKDAILLACYNAAIDGSVVFVAVSILAFSTVLITAYYVVRQLLLVFFNDYRGIGEVNENSTLMKIVLVVLALMSLGIIWSINPFSISSVWVLQLFVANEFINGSVLVPFVSILLIVIGGTLAYVHYRNYQSEFNSSIFHKLSLHNWYLDKTYNTIIIKPFDLVVHRISIIETKVIDRLVNWTGIFGAILSQISGWIDRALIDGFVNFSVIIVGRTGRMTKSVQSGNIQSYIIWAILGIVTILYIIIS